MKSIPSVAVIVTGLALSSCGDGSDETDTGGGSTTTQPAQSQTLDRSGIEDCLASAGLDTAKGPLVAGSRTIGIKLPGGGGISPGSFSAAIFVSDSEAGAKQEATTFRSAFGSSIEQRGNVVILYDPSGKVPADVRSKIVGCTGAE